MDSKSNQRSNLSAQEKTSGKKSAKNNLHWKLRSFHFQRNVDFMNFVTNFIKLLLLPVIRSQTERVYSTQSDEPWSSRSQALGWCFYANTSVSRSSGTPPMSTLKWTSLQEGLLGRESHPRTPLGRADHLKRKIKKGLEFS